MENTKRDSRQGAKLQAVVSTDANGNKRVSLPSGTVLPLDSQNRIRHDNVLGTRKSFPANENHKSGF